MPILQIPAVAADTTQVSSFFEKMSHASDMSLQQFLEQIISSMIHGALKILVAAVVFWIGRWIVRKIKRIVTNVLERRQVETSLKTFLLSLVNISLMLILLVMVIGILGINTSSFVALFASAGVAVGMALSGTLQNFAGGVMILLFKPYKVGDYIEAQGQSGTVKEIQIFNTVLNTPDNKTIFVPNGGLSTGIINNFSKEGIRRVDWIFSIAYGTDFDRAKHVLQHVLDENPLILKTPAYSILLSAMEDSAVHVTVRAWAPADIYWDVYFDMNERVYKAFEKECINIPFPQMDVHLVSPQGN
ncbi:MAG: mechanosensitive ion channel [Coprobacter sp.]|nr:mechanosensitive ion channel [Coprobacter sp.]